MSSPLDGPPRPQPEREAFRGLSFGTEEVEGIRATRRELEHLTSRLQRILESITDAFVMLDREWRFTYVNAEAEGVIGRRREEILGRVIWDAYPGLEGTIFGSEYRRAASTGDAVRFEGYYPNLSRWFSVRAFPSEEGLSLYFNDITHEKEREELLRTSEERFRLVARATTDTIWDWDLETGLVWWNDGLTSAFGYSKDDIEPDTNSWTSRIHPEDLERVTTGIHAVQEGGAELWEDRYRFRRADGSYAFVVDRGFVIRGSDGRAVRMLGGMTDLTAEQETARKLEEQAALLEIARDAILVREMDGTIVFWNRSAELLYGWSRAEALGKSVETLLYKDPTAFRKAAKTVLSRGEWSGEITQVCRDGRSVVVEGRWSLIRDGAGRPHRVLAINTDITERKRLEAQFLRAQRMESIGTLASGIAHDLNNVLAPILMSIELLKMDISDPETLETVGTIEASAVRGAAMVKQVLAFARGMDGERIPVSMARVVKDIRSIVGEALPRNIRIESTIPDDLWLTKGDPTQIHQVLLNLALNARDAMPEGGALRILTENVWIDEHFASMERALRPGPHVLIEITDTGMGIPADAIDRIFEPFFTTKELGRGTGLGLSTAQAIVRSHAGCILALSEVGRGSTFRVYLPADSSTVEGGLVTLPPPELHRGNGELILVADDETAIRTITQQTLEAFGYRVLIAEDGTAAVAVYAQNQGEIALVLTDIMMPNLDGLAAIPALQRMNPEVKILATTGLRGQGLIERARAAGVIDIIEKPFSAERLLSALHTALS